MQVAGYLDYFEGLIEKGGPDFSDYDSIQDATLELRNMTVEDQAKFFKVLKPIFDINSMIGHTFLKPYGYAGDFELINRIYTQWETEDNKYKKWDKLYNWADSATAVRNRKQYFIDQVTNTSLNNETPLVLNLGSGPCTDVFEYFQKSPRSPVKFECVDMDEKSNEFGAAVCDNYIDSITFINRNVFLFNTEKEYDLIWSAGLFDYFNDKLFVKLTNRYFKFLKKGGELIIGNFSENNPSRGLMEVLCQWYLYHRSEEKLIELALKAGVPKENIEVRSEETGINLFLHIFK